ncbi:MAG: signal peptidase II [Coriobacteriaceae bacterium]|jgi:signal peptidase II|nr:signal peptidase II [Coriobacteriaceae bacterium]
MTDREQASKDEAPSIPGSEASKEEMPSIPAKDARAHSRRIRNTVVFSVAWVVWMILDGITKASFNDDASMGAVLGGPVLGLFRFRLVHNTGAAWGIFDDSTFALGIMALAVCLFILWYFLVVARTAPLLEVLGLGLVFAGGLGNAINRFSLGYVVDFIEFTFIEFPVFNVADIGITCGFAIFILHMAYGLIRSERASRQARKAQRTGQAPVALQTEGAPGAEDAPKTEGAPGAACFAPSENGEAVDADPVNGASPAPEALGDAMPSRKD